MKEIFALIIIIVKGRIKPQIRKKWRNGENKRNKVKEREKEKRRSLIFFMGEKLK